MANETDQSNIDTTSSNFDIPDGMSKLFVDPISLVAFKTIKLPPNPPDLYYQRIFYGGQIISGTVITAVTIQANTGQGIIGVTTGLMVAGGSMLFVYRTQNSKWYRAQ